MFCSITTLLLYVSSPELPDFTIGFNEMSCSQLHNYVVFAEENVKKLDRSGVSAFELFKNKNIFTYQICYANMKMKEKSCTN